MRLRRNKYDFNDTYLIRIFIKPFSDIKNIQGVRLERSESYCLLLLKYENYGHFNPTGGSPDVVHLIK